MSKSPHKDSDGVLRITITSEGKPISDTLFALISVSVYKAVNKIGRATLRFVAGDMAEQNVPESEDESFAPGKKIKIEAGYGEDEKIIFEGRVVNHNVLLTGEGTNMLEIECRDYAFPTTLSRRNNIFEKKKDSEAIQTILGNYPDLSPSVDTTNGKHNELVQYYCSDWDFILSRADANGLVIVTEGSIIHVKKPATTASADLRVTYGNDVIEFRGELSTADQLAKYKAAAWDMAAQESQCVTAVAPSLNSQGADPPEALAKASGGENMLLQTAVSSNESTLLAWANSQRLKAGLAKIQGYCKFQGSADARHGGTIELDGFGKRFNGTAYIGYVEHEICGGKWTTTAGLGLAFENITDRPDVTAPPASGLLPGIEGLHLGKVTKLDEDPTGENKVQVAFSVLDCETKTVWARLGCFWASSSYGAYFIPDVGDEVILGFFNNDPCHAVILGSLYSSKQQPVEELSAENKIRCLTTKSKMKIEFEEEKKRITIETPGKNKIVICDEDKAVTLEDQNKNKIAMNESGILIESSKDIIIKSKQKIVIDSGTKLEIKAKNDIEMKGMNVKANADVNLELKGNAKAEINASGQTIVKGAMVMIN